MSNIVKMSGSKAKKEAVPLAVRIAAVANAQAIKDSQWRQYSAAQSLRQKSADDADSAINKARAVWQATINKRLKPDGYCEVNSISVNPANKCLCIQSDCHSNKHGKYPMVKIVFSFGFKTDDDFDFQIGTLKGILIAASRGQE